MYLDHISFRCTSYKETVAFYEALLGWKGLGDEGSQNETQICAGDRRTAHSRRERDRRRRSRCLPARNASMDHISFGISPFDPDVVAAELCKRGLQA